MTDDQTTAKSCTLISERKSALERTSEVIPPTSESKPSVEYQQDSEGGASRTELHKNFMREQALIKLARVLKSFYRHEKIVQDLYAKISRETRIYRTFGLIAESSRAEKINKVNTICNEMYQERKAMHADIRKLREVMVSIHLEHQIPEDLKELEEAEDVFTKACVEYARGCSKAKMFLDKVAADCNLKTPDL
ncbi:hypothetical protein BDV96DRAFT_608042 [Lophiotrema nucula]|uniref:Uncharacterized protein n=1 Tax=Lophiotrema nucula TaxID=690887 RepID=A0A6A5YFZ3_9PLEO|nr:hypothetical protein BDV96DRAFT_608042 [Lophiotrema nucula]